MVGVTSGRGDGTGGGRIAHGPRPAVGWGVPDEADLIRTERSILEMVATGVATDTVLHDTARAVQRFVEGWRCSVMIADPAGLELHMVAAPSFPASFIDGCQHVRVGRRGGTCGTAAARRERVITPDVRSDPSWRPFLSWVAPYGIRAAWSTPLLDPRGALLGTFALYHADVRRPGDDAFEIVDRLAHLASITLSRDRAAVQVAAVRANLEMLIQASPAALIEVDTDLKVRLWNPAAERMFGWRADEVLGRSKPTVPEAEADAFHTRMSQTLAGRITPPVETTRVTRSGELVDVELATAPVRDADGDVVGVVEIITDISGRKRAEASLRAAYDTERATVEHLKELDRLARGVIEAELAPTPLDQLVRGVIASCDALATRSVHVELEPVIALVDAVKVERIVENLITNAARHTPEATPLWVRLERAADEIHLTVADAGPGITGDDRERIFQPFAQATDRVGAESSGVGIGLSLVARLTALHGGQVWVDDRPGGGAVFHVLLPLSAPAAA